jgi:hypothetical protein
LEEFQFILDLDNPMRIYQRNKEPTIKNIFNIIQLIHYRMLVIVQISSLLLWSMHNGVNIVKSSHPFLQILQKFYQSTHTYNLERSKDHLIKLEVINQQDTPKFYSGEVIDGIGLLFIMAKDQKVIYLLG